MCSIAILDAVPYGIVALTPPSPSCCLNMQKTVDMDHVTMRESSIELDGISVVAQTPLEKVEINGFCVVSFPFYL